MKSEPTGASELLTTNRKALTINLDPARYGTFAEIGAGQETCRFFFQAGGAAGTVAKTMSAYDMTFSDSIYGKAGRYVSQERVEKMIDHEYELLQQRLDATFGAERCFFSFANTMKAKGYKGGDDAHGWLGIRFQATPRAQPDEIILHARMWDPENVQQQQAVGILGVNLIYGAIYFANNPERLLKSLLDNLGPERVEVDLVHFRGPSFATIDNRIANLQLVRHGLTNAVLFAPDGQTALPSDALRKKTILVERGSFRPITRVNLDILERAADQFIQDPSVRQRDTLVVAEITMSNLLASGELNYEDFLARIETVRATGLSVLVSNYFEFYRLTAYFRRYTQEKIGVAMGVSNLLEIFDESYYTHLAGGILENFGRLFRNDVTLYIYPMKQLAYRRYLAKRHPDTAAQAEAAANPSNAPIITCQNLGVAHPLRHLYLHLLENGYIKPIQQSQDALLDVMAPDTRAAIARRDPAWESMVPPPAAQAIKQNLLFGYLP